MQNMRTVGVFKSRSTSADMMNSVFELLQGPLQVMSGMKITVISGQRSGPIKSGI